MWYSNYLHLYVFWVPPTHQVIEMQVLALFTFDSETVFTSVGSCQRELRGQEW